jgi:hypothetical protein
MRLQNETLDGSCNPSWWELMRRRLLTLFPSYRLDDRFHESCQLS